MTVIFDIDSAKDAYIIGMMFGIALGSTIMLVMQGTIKEIRKWRGRKIET